MVLLSLMATASFAADAQSDDMPRVTVAPPAVATADGIVQGPMPLNDQSQWVTTDDYPIEALRDLRSGITAVELMIDRTGTVSSCRIVSRSGSDSLDRAACMAIQERARFSPAVGIAGEAIASRFTKRVVWRIPDAVEPVPVEPGFMAASGVIARIHFDANGVQTQCRLDYVGGEGRAASPNDAICAQYPVFPGGSREGMIGPDGIWLELRQIGYVYTNAPPWAVRSNLAPSEEPPPPLPPGAG